MPRVVWNNNLFFSYENVLPVVFGCTFLHDQHFCKSGSHQMEAQNVQWWAVSLVCCRELQDWGDKDQISQIFEEGTELPLPYNHPSLSCSPGTHLMQTILSPVTKGVVILQAEEYCSEWLPGEKPFHLVHGSCQASSGMRERCRKTEWYLPRVECKSGKSRSC